MKLDGHTLRSTLEHLGFRGDFLEPEHSGEFLDLAVGTPCYRAFFKIVDSTRDLEDAWKNGQDQLAGYKNRFAGIPRDLYLNFILTGPIAPTDEEIIRHIVDDAMVCRKLILRASDDDLASLFMALPFVGLEIGNTAAAPGIRHVLAVLESKGYPSEITSSLTGWGSTDKLLTTLLSLPVPKSVPSITDTNSLTDSDAEESQDVFRLDSLCIKDFRGIRNLQLDLSSDLTIIFGLNGTGKTSVFDAIEWALLGELERLQTKIPDELIERSPLVNLFSQSDGATVELRLKQHDRSLDVERTIASDGSSALLVNGQRTSDDHAVLDHLMPDQESKVDIRNLRKVLSTGNFLSQTTLRKFLSESPDVRYRSLSYLLGTQDYTRLIERITELRTLLQKRLQKLDAELSLQVDTSSELEAQIEARKAVLADSRAMSDLISQLKDASLTAAEKLRHLNNPFADLLVGAANNYREIRSALSVIIGWLHTEQEKQKTAEDRARTALDAVDRITRTSPSRNSLLEQMESIRSDITKVQNEVAPFVSQEIGLKAQLDALAVDLHKHNLRVGELSGAKNLARDLTSIEELETDQRQELEAANKELAQHQREQTALSAELTLAEKTKSGLTMQLADHRSQLESIAETQTLLNSWIEMSAGIPELEQQLRTLIATEGETQKQRVSLKEQTGSFSSELAALTLEIQVQSASHEELSSLLIQIQTHVTDSECPLCGHDWTAVDTLRTQIGKRTQGISSKLHKLLERQQELIDKIDLTERAIISIDQQLARSQAVKRELLARQDAYKTLTSEIESKAARLLGASVSSFQERAKAVQTLYATIRIEHDRVDYEDRVLASRISELKAAVERCRHAISAAESRLNNISSALASTAGRVAALRSDLAKVGVDPGSDVPTTIAERIHVAQGQISTLTIGRQDAETKLRDCRLRLSADNTKLATLEQQQKALSQELGSIEGAIARSSAIISNSGFTADVTSAQISEVIQRLQDQTSAISAALDDLSQIDSISGLLIAKEERDVLEANLLQARASLEGINSQIQTRNMWHSHLSDFALTLIDAKTKTERWQLEKYEPTTNLLYRRFNPHPLFGTIKVAIDPAKPSLRISTGVSSRRDGQGARNIEGLSPGRYFSEAQLNVLAVSIFLSHSLQQRSSRFVTLLLDDPVQQMDSLRVNNFIDTLRGLVGEKRQFIISTCDINLYRLMLLKLRCLNHSGGIRFRAYRLEGSSPTGPEVVQDCPAVPSPMQDKAIA